MRKILVHTSFIYHVYGLKHLLVWLQESDGLLQILHTPVEFHRITLFSTEETGIETFVEVHVL